MELRHLEHFVAVAEERSFTRAALRVHLVQSALSVSVRALERELGARLLARTTHRVELTDEGRALLPEARRTLAAARAARDAVAEVHQGVRGTLRLGVMQALVAIDLGSLLARFHKQAPLVELRPRPALTGSAGLVEELRQGRLDLAFIAVPGDPPAGLTCTVLSTEPILLVCPAGHRLAKPRSALPLADLAGQSFVDFPIGWGTRTAVDLAFARAGVGRSVSIEVGDVSTLADLVRAGLGVSLVPRSVLPRRDGIVLRRVTPSPTFDIALAVPADRPIPAAARAFVDLVRSA